jgi:hypothetical protein
MQIIRKAFGIKQPQSPADLHVLENENEGSL